MFGSDTFEVFYFFSFVSSIAVFFQADAASEYFFQVLSDRNRNLWEYQFVSYLDRLARKHYLFSGDTGKRLFIKGHFLAAGPALAARYVAPLAHCVFSFLFLFPFPF